MDKTYESFYEQGMGKAANEGFEPDIAKGYADNYAKELIKAYEALAKKELQNGKTDTAEIAAYYGLTQQRVDEIKNSL